MEAQELQIGARIRAWDYDSEEYRVVVVVGHYYGLTATVGAGFDWWLPVGYTDFVLIGHSL